MKLLHFNLVVTVFGNHYLYPTFEGESGNVFTAKNYLLSARSREELDKKIQENKWSRSKTVMHGTANPWGIGSTPVGSSSMVT